MFLCYVLHCVSCFFVMYYLVRVVSLLCITLYELRCFFVMYYIV